MKAKTPEIRWIRSVFSSPQIAAFAAVIVSLSFTPPNVEAQYTFTTDNGALTLKKYIGPGGQVIVPSTFGELPVTGIAPSAFANCTTVTEVVIPDSVTSIGWNAFPRCTSLTAVTVDLLNPSFTSIEGVLFDHGRTTLIQYPAGRSGDYALPEGVTAIGSYGFYYCLSLTSVTLPQSLCTTQDFAFSDCTGLTVVNVPGNVTNLGPYSFEYCSTLQAVSIPNSVNTIRDGVLFHCTGLTNVTIPSSVVGIGNSALEKCDSLIEINVDALNPVYSSAEGILFNKSKTLLIRCPGGKPGDVVIPETVTSIEDYAFSFCTRLANVRLPSKLTRVASYAFAHTALTGITVPDGVAAIGSSASAFCSNLRAVCFFGNAPSVGSSQFLYNYSVIVYYLPGTTGWGTTFGGRPTAPWVLPNPRVLGDTIRVEDNAFSFTISWATNVPVVVEAATSPAGAQWFPVATNTLTAGSCDFTDAESANYPSRFYRVRGL